ncbi:hypothetical protein CGRA01v4_06476 [Colletotrichum graminicola]|uniref:Uncharacterized protein n=1 Tax=Colletotrichum graminicola (strain M1.001 / M2 / FGSC 10212) TaxID=645133 RepID=E3Q284_COLGM|nr:uncharacterized protein GLRG_00329 [Colletotrichum graminicola M1.001]EFQ25185.1 hypothetical protein GLRG_00329 [Colletotrichum graminicola M1.001]WDK15195.1 hypothetical protein CGRA01v4_06476 [Colletotrichum graminicola]
MDQSTKPEVEPKDDSVTDPIQAAKRTCDVLSAGIKSMKIPKAIDKAKNLADYIQILEFSDMINDMRIRVNVSRSSIQDVRNSTLDEQSIKLLGEVDQGFDTLLTRIEGLRECVDQWMETMKGGWTPLKKDKTSPAA